MPSLHLSPRQPVLCHSPHAMALHVDAGRAWVTVDCAHGADTVLNAGDTLQLPAGARALASGLPHAVLSLHGLGQALATPALQTT